jgi:periplasmic divalent cation tolerance protein
VQSIYRWQGEVEEATEALIILKTSAELLPRLAERVAQLHSYEVPEVLALPVVFGTCAYLDWLAGSLLTNGVEDGA